MSKELAPKPVVMNISSFSNIAQKLNFLAQGITVATADAPQGYKSLVVRIEGNTIKVEVTIKIVEGIDFVLADINIERAVQG